MTPTPFVLLVLSCFLPEVVPLSSKCEELCRQERADKTGPFKIHCVDDDYDLEDRKCGPKCVTHCSYDECPFNIVSCEAEKSTAKPTTAHSVKTTEKPSPALIVLASMLYVIYFLGGIVLLVAVVCVCGHFFGRHRHPSPIQMALGIGRGARGVAAPATPMYTVAQPQVVGYAPQQMPVSPQQSQMQQEGGMPVAPPPPQQETGK